MMTDMRDYLTLYADSLLSKWGFNDGDTPNELLDYCDMRGIEYPAYWRDRVLPLLVRERLLPVLDQTVEVEVIGTIHNPIRATAVDGKPVNVLEEQVERQTELTPESVTVLFSEVLAIAGRSL